MSRGDRREAIFLNDVDRHDFLKTLAEAYQKTGWQVHAYCLMPNNFPLVGETRAERIIAEELTARGRTTGQLTRRLRNDPAKLAIATRLRNETTLTVKQISQRLHLGTQNSAKVNLHRYQHDRPNTIEVAPSQKEFAGI
ncbi:MAG TPA: hypothetical protein VF773_10770 [Verrucomicrobiae bacterium]